MVLMHQKHFALDTKIHHRNIMMLTFKIFVCIGQLFLSYHSTTAVGIALCGNASSTNECHKHCFDGCQQRVNSENITNTTVKEDIATQTNLCVNKCFGNEYIPLTYADISKLPSYSDSVDCLGRCAQPAHVEYCLKGYLSSFFYCDCHKCCLQKTDDKKCVRGCHNWFLRQWSPKEGEGCRFRKEYRNSPTSWCTAYCIHAVLESDPTLTWNDIPNIKTTTGAQCIGRCVSFLSYGVPVDYDVDPRCADITKCMEVWAMEFNSFTTYAMDVPYLEGFVRKNVSMFDLLFLKDNGGDQVATFKFNNSKSITHEFNVSRSPALDNMHSLGVSIGSDLDSGDRSRIPNGTLDVFPWRDIGCVLFFAYNYDYDPRLIKCTSTHFASYRKFEVEPCTQLLPNVLVKIAEKVRFEYEVYVEIFDGKSLLSPLTATQLRSAIEQRPEWRDLQFVTYADAKTLVMKGKGHGFVKFGLGIAYEDVSGCSYPRNPSATELCRVVDFKESEDYGHTYYYGGNYSLLG